MPSLLSGLHVARTIRQHFRFSVTNDVLFLKKHSIILDELLLLSGLIGLSLPDSFCVAG